MVEWWDDLGTPELTPDLIGLLVDGVEAEIGGREVSITAARDRALRDLIALKKAAAIDEPIEDEMNDHGIGSWTTRRARMLADKPALVDGGHMTTYGELDQRAVAAARGLRPRA